LLGEIQRFANRIPVPVNFAGWEDGGRESPAVVVQAQSLRTALLGCGTREGLAPAPSVLVALAALLVLMRDWRHALSAARSGRVRDPVVAVLACAAGGLRTRRGRPLATLVLAWPVRARDRSAPSSSAPDADAPTPQAGCPIFSTQSVGNLDVARGACGAPWLQVVGPLLSRSLLGGEAKSIALPCLSPVPRPGRDCFSFPP
jgi:hypothetical protein